MPHCTASFVYCCLTSDLIPERKERADKTASSARIHPTSAQRNRSDCIAQKNGTKDTLLSAAIRGENLSAGKKDQHQRQHDKRARGNLGD